MLSAAVFKLRRIVPFLPAVTLGLLAVNCSAPRLRSINLLNQPPAVDRASIADDSSDNDLEPSQLMVTDSTSEQLVCYRSQGSSLQGEMHYISGKGQTKLGIFQNGHVGSCEASRRAARNGVACIESGNSYQAIRIDSRKIVKAFGHDIEQCLAFTKNSDTSKRSSQDLRFIEQAQLDGYLKNVPSVADPQINAALRGQDSIWYDENSMVFTYQDSFGNPTGPEGLRANRVGYDVGSTAQEPGIKKLTQFFELQTFQYPFSIQAGRTDRGNTEALYFWVPPRDENGRRLPVAWWKNGSHWHWVFPVGTIMGEVLLIRENTAKSEWYVHEIRTRVRELNRWKTDIFRPFPRATDLAEAIKNNRPNWQSSDLKQLVDHLENSSTLIPGRLDSKAYEQAVPSIEGYYDEIPGTQDVKLIKKLLKRTTFKSTMNTEWKSSGSKVTYAPTTAADFHIVPKKYRAGLFKTDEQSCLRCHNQTGRPLGQLDKNVILYGEIWGEDEVFTWHPFKVYSEIYTVSDGSRIANPRMVEAGLLIQKKPAAGDTNYHELPRGYVPNYSF